MLIGFQTRIRGVLLQIITIGLVATYSRQQDGPTLTTKKTAEALADLFAEVDGAFADLFADVNGAFADLFADVNGAFADRFSDVNGAFADRFSKVDGAFADRFSKVDGAFADRFSKVNGAFADRYAYVFADVDGTFADRCVEVDDAPADLFAEVDGAFADRYAEANGAFEERTAKRWDGRGKEVFYAVNARFESIGKAVSEKSLRVDKKFAEIVQAVVGALFALPFDARNALIQNVLVDLSSAHSFLSFVCYVGGLVRIDSRPIGGISRDDRVFKRFESSVCFVFPSDIRVQL